MNSSKHVEYGLKKADSLLSWTFGSPTSTFGVESYKTAQVV